MLPGPSASELTNLWRYRNLFIIIIIIIWILLEQETVSGSGISLAMCKSASRSRQITMPVPHHSCFLQAGCPSCHPTNSIKALFRINAVKIVAFTTVSHTQISPLPENCGEKIENGQKLHAARSQFSGGTVR